VARFEIAEGYLQIDAETSAALADVKKFFAEVDSDLKGTEKDFARSGDKSGKNFASASANAAKGNKAFQALMGDVLSDVEKEFEHGGEHSGEKFSKAITESVRRHSKTTGKGLLDDLLPGDIGGGRSFFASLTSGASRFFASFARGLSRIFGGGNGSRGFFGMLIAGAGDFFSKFASGLSDAISSGAKQLQQLGESLSGVFEKIGSVGGGIGSVAMIGAWAILIPVVLGLAGALVQLSAALFALPAAVAVLLAVIAPLMIALHGFGEAISAGLSGDVNKFNEALKKLAPNAQKVAKEFVGLAPILKQIKTSVQDAFFGPLVGHVAQLGSTLLPVLSVGLSHVAGALGRIAAAFVDLLSSPAAVKGINEVFMTTERILDRMGPSLIKLFDGIGRLVEAGLPWVEKFFGVIGDALGSLGGWLTQITQDGSLNSWLARAWDIGKKLWDVLKGLGEFAFLLLNSLGDEGTDTLKGMGDALKNINKYLQSKEGLETLHNLGVLVHWAGNALVFLMDNTVVAWRALNVLFDFIRGIGPFFSALGHDIADIARAIGHWFAEIGRTVWGALVTATKAVGDFFAAIGNWFVGVWNAVVKIGGQIIDWFAALPGRIWDWLQTLPGMLKDAWMQMYDEVLFQTGRLAGILVKFFVTDFPGWIRDGWAWAVSYVEEGAKRTWDRITALPGQIWQALTDLGNLIKNTFMDAWNWAVAYVEEGATKTWNRITALPGQIWGALKDIASMIGNFFADAWRQAKDFTINGIKALMDFVYGLPGKVSGALSGAKNWLVEVGRDVIRGLADGIADMLDWVVERAKDVARRIKDGFTSVFDSHSPSQAMRRDVGRTLLPGIKLGMDDTMPDMQKYLGVTGRMIIDGLSPTVNVAAPNVSVGGTTLIADLGEGIRQVVPVTIMRNPTTVAAATDEGRRRRGWVYSPRAKS